MSTIKERVENYFFGNPKLIGKKILFIKRDKRLTEYKQYLDEVHEFGNVWHGITGFLRGERVSVIVTGVGPSAVGDAVYALNRPNTICLYSGTCGGLAKTLNIGDYFVAEQAICGDGFSFHLGYAPLSSVFSASDLSMAIKTFLTEKFGCVGSGMAFTTSTVVREFEPDFWMSVNKEVQAIEMGAAAFYAAAQATGKKAAAYYWVTDLPRRGKSFLEALNPQEMRIKQERYEQAVSLDIELLECVE